MTVGRRSNNVWSQNLRDRMVVPALISQPCDGEIGRYTPARGSEQPVVSGTDRCWRLSSRTSQGVSAGELAKRETPYGAWRRCFQPVHPNVHSRSRHRRQADMCWRYNYGCAVRS